MSGETSSSHLADGLARGCRVDRWQLRSQALQLPKRPLLMGIVNVTPDSFSDGGRFFEPQRAVERALQLADEGADILDVGGESTRPYSDPVPEEEERRRVLQVVEQVARQSSVPVSIDTSKAVIARDCLQAGAEIINDVTGLEGDPEMVSVAREFQAGLCVMHMQGTPQTMQENPTYQDVTSEVQEYLRRRRDALVAAGISPNQICLDPGIGFGKTHDHNLRLLAECWRFHQLGCPILVGHSRKGFIGQVLQNKDRDRTAGTIGVALALAAQGVQVIRVHDVAPVAEALLLFEAVGGIDAHAITRSIDHPLD